MFSRRMVTKLLLYAAGKKEQQGNISWLISYQTYAYMLLNMFGRVGTLSLKSYFCPPCPPIKAQAEV